jgi:hypothetical protein
MLAYHPDALRSSCGHEPKFIYAKARLRTTPLLTVVGIAKRPKAVGC